MSVAISGQVFNIQRYSIHDGAGIRTLVFLKGCPLRCLWCCNPESQKGGPELGFIASRCVGDRGCGAPCVPACPISAIRLGPEGRPEIDRAACDACGRCAAACGPEALRVVGREMTVAGVMAEVEKDRPFYRRSGGGMTVGGGEPLAQHRFAAALLEAARDAYLHTALETCGHGPWAHLEGLLRHVDLLQFDIKHMDAARHRELTGQSNDLVLANLKRVPAVKPPGEVIIRVPVVPGCNDSADNVRETAALVAGLGFRQVELVPYHRLGAPKYVQYGIPDPLPDCPSASGGRLEELRRIVEEAGLTETGGTI